MAISEDITLNHMSPHEFSLWSKKALQEYLLIRKKKTEGTFEELCARAFIAWEDHASVDPSQEHLLRSNLEDYKSKLVHESFILPDPYSLSSDWLPESTGIAHWPSIYFMDICQYLQMTTPKELLARLCNEYKQGKAFRYFTSGRVGPVHYHPITANSNITFLAAKVAPSMRSEKYEAWVAVEKDSKEMPGGSIVAGYCTCTAGLKGTCNHIAGILFRVEYAVRTGMTKPSCTSQACTWKIPAANKENKPIKLCEQKWKRDSYLKKDSDDYQSSVNYLATKFTPLSVAQEEYVAEGNICGDLATIVSKHAPNSCFIQLFDSKPFPKKVKKVCPSSPVEYHMTN